MVLIRVDFPRPVCPVGSIVRQYSNLDLSGAPCGDGSFASPWYHVPTQMTLNWKPRFRSLRSICEVMLSKPTWLWGKMEVVGVAILLELSVQGRTGGVRKGCVVFSRL